jgi:hypothetical protein
VAESPEIKYYREQKLKEEEDRKNRSKMAQAVRTKLLEQEKSRSLWQKTKDYFSGKLLESEKAHPESVSKATSLKKESAKPTDRTSQVTEQLKKAGLSEEQIKKLKGSK